MSTFASDSGHFYTQTGEPAYTIMGKNGKERNTTVRDAKKLGLVPSVTEIMKVMAKPGLENWKTQQVLQASLTLPMLENESLDEYSVRVMEDSRAQGQKAADRGTEIHGQLERYFSGHAVDPQYRHTCLMVDEELFNRFGEQHWNTEVSFASSLGYGGKCDLSCEDLVLDFKTKEFTADRLPVTYDEHAMQLAAYRMGMSERGIRRSAECAIVFVSASSPVIHVAMIDSGNLERGWAMFQAMFDLWRAKNRYYPMGGNNVNL